MSEQTGNTQPIRPVTNDDTKPIKPIKKTRRWGSLLIGIFGFLLLAGLGGLGGYNSGIGDRTNAKNEAMNQQLAEQYKLALVDIQFSRYDAAKQRLEYIINNDPSYPGAQEELTKVMVLGTIPTATTVPTLTPTPDLRGVESAYQRAQQLTQAQDWPGALGALDQLRKMDRKYKTAQVDGMYYFALRNYGYNQITKLGNLEGGIYQLTLAERFGPLDNTAYGLREAARMYITGASFWGLDWAQAVTYFSQVGAGWPSMWDGTMTASERLFNAHVNYGNELYDKDKFCDAYDQYQAAATIGNLDEKAAGHSNQAFQKCYPPTEIPTGTGIAPIETPTPTP